MIELDFSFAIALYLLLFLNAVLIIWVFGRKPKDKDFTLEDEFLWFCSVCTYTYVNTRQDLISTCPRCGSYNKK